MEKIKEYIKKALDKLTEIFPSVQAQHSMVVILSYGALLGIMSGAFLFAWIYNGLSSDHFNTEEMIRFFMAATSAGPVAAVTFLSVFLVDKNKDGRPDAAEEKAEKGEIR